MECKKIQEKLSAYIEGLTSAEEQSMIEEHIESCRGCKKSLADLEKTISFVGDLKDVEPPAWLSQRIMARIREEAEPKDNILHKLFYPLHIKLPIQALATVLIAVSAFYIFRIIQPEVMPSKGVVDEMTVPKVQVKDKDVMPKSTKLDNHASPIGEGLPAITADVPERDREVDRGTAGKGVQIESFLKGNRRLTSHLKEEVIADEVRKPLPAEPIEQRYHAKESETPDRHGEVPITQPPVEKRETQKAVNNGEEVGGVSFKEGKLALEKQRYFDITLIVEKLEKARRDIDKIVEHLGWKIIKTEEFNDKTLLIISCDDSKTDELLRQLRLIGEIKEELVLKERKGYKEIGIELVEK